MLKQKADGTWVIQTQSDLDQAVSGIEEREEAIREIEEQMEEEYDYLTMRQEIADLNEAVRLFMVEMDVKHVFRDNYKITLIRRATSKWNPEKLKKLISKAVWLKITTQEIDPHKIDALVREGKLDEKQIAPAFEQTPTKPFVQRYPYKEGQDRDAAMAEEMALRQAMSQEAVEAAGKPEKRGKKARK